VTRSSGANPHHERLTSRGRRRSAASHGPYESESPSPTVSGSPMTIFGLAGRPPNSYPNAMTRRTLLAIVILLAAPGIANACFCGPIPVCQRFWTADAVFTGTVASITVFDEKWKVSHTTVSVERGSEERPARSC
jgi:hypothetical protein